MKAECNDTAELIIFSSVQSKDVFNQIGALVGVNFAGTVVCCATRVSGKAADT